jgi:hypothetical protein
MSHFSCKIICKLTVLHVNNITMENKIKSNIKINTLAYRLLTRKMRKMRKKILIVKK